MFTARREIYIYIYIYIFLYIYNMNHLGVETLLSKKKEIIKIIKAMPSVILFLRKKRKEKNK
jgi:hypothetical protein